MRAAKISFVLNASLVLGLAGCSSHTNCSNPGSGATGGSSSGVSSGSIATSSCGVGGGSYSALLYSVDASKGQIAAAGLDTSGSLVPLTSFVSPTISGSPDQMVIVNKQFVYIPMGDTTIQAFAIDRSSGALTAINGSPYTVPTTSGTTDSVTSDPQGKFLFVGSEFTGEIWAYTIDSKSGALTLVAGSPFTVPISGVFTSADSLAVDAGGGLLYVGQGDPTLGVMAFQIQTSGALTQVGGSPFHLGVAQLHAAPTSEFLLGTAEIPDQAGSGTDTHIYVFSLTGGIPTLVDAVTTVSAPYDFMIVPNGVNGNLVFTFGVTATTGAQAAMEGFQLSSSTGQMTPLPGSLASLPLVFDCQVDQNGSESFCIDGYGGTKFSVLNINSATGAIGHTGTDLTVGPTYAFALTD